jgi:Golgi apparatus protein 1
MLLLLQVDNSKALDWVCLTEVLRVEKEAASDIRLNIKLFKACLSDQKKFCKDVEPGHMRVQVGQLLGQGC